MKLKRFISKRYSKIQPSVRILGPGQAKTCGVPLGSACQYEHTHEPPSAVVTVTVDPCPL